MPNDRRYSEEEIAAIFGKAAEAESVTRGRRSAEGGLTLSELQEIGSETGLSAVLIARAAASIDADFDAEPSPTFLGMPLSAA